MLYDNPDALLLFRCAGELGMPVTFHLEYNRRQSHSDPWTEWWGGGIDNIERVLHACPNTNFLGHAPGFWLHISNDDLYQRVNYPPADAPVVPGGRLELLMRKYSNLHCDISAGSGFLALNRDHDYTRRFLAEFQDRVLFARDYFDSRHADLIRSLALPDAVSAKILGGNAERLLADTH
jgi:predicted TIM-barrel fold metal-dependent hydrolase